MWKCETCGKEFPDRVMPGITDSGRNVSHCMTCYNAGMGELYGC